MNILGYFASHVLTYTCQKAGLKSKPALNKICKQFILHILSLFRHNHKILGGNGVPRPLSLGQYLASTYFFYIQKDTFTVHFTNTEINNYYLKSTRQL